MPIRIRTRLLFGYLAGVIILLIIASIGMYSRSILIQGLEKTGAIAEELHAAHTMSLALERVLMPANDYLISGDIREKDNYTIRLAEVMEALKELEKVEQNNELINTLREKTEKINAEAEKIFSLHPVKQTSEGSLFMYAMDNFGKEAYYIVMVDTKIDKQELDTVIEKNKWIITFVNSSMLGGGIAALIFGIFFVFYMERSVRFPIEMLSKGVKGLNGGKWTKVEIRDGLEITSLADEYNKMVERLRSAYESLEDKVRERTAQLNELNKKLEILSITDGLTGLYNHRHFYERLKMEILRAARYNHDLSLIIIDVDFFKHYNDNHGHLAGDIVLKGIADCIKSGVREIDITARYGGEEFAVILPEVDKKGALAFAERIRNIVASHPFPNKETQPNGNLTISLGVAAFPEDTAVSDNALIQMADDAMYEAKELGRNRVATAKKG